MEMNAHQGSLTAVRSVTTAVLAVAELLVAAASLPASSYDVSTTAGNGNQITNSPTPVSVTGSYSFGQPFGTLAWGSGAGLAAGGPGLANSVAAVLVFTDEHLTGGGSSYVQSSGNSMFNEIVITGPPGTPVGTEFEYSVNLIVTTELQANQSGPGDLYTSALAGLRWGTGSSLGGFGGADLGHLHVQGDGLYEATGIFSGLSQGQAHGVVGSTTTWRGRTGDTISVSLSSDTTAQAGDYRGYYGPGGAQMSAKASLQVTFLGISVFNLSVPGADANSTDGTIAHNQISGAAGPVGNYNGDGVIDAADYIVWRHSLGQLTAGRYIGGDGNGNSFVDLNDYDVWRAHFGQAADSGSGANANAAVPEPATLVMLMFAVST
jgi:hypothetical protein